MTCNGVFFTFRPSHKESPTKAPSMSSKSSTSTIRQSPVTAGRRNITAMNFPPQSSSPPNTTPSIHSTSDQENHINSLSVELKPPDQSQSSGIRNNHSQQSLTSNQSQPSLPCSDQSHSSITANNDQVTSQLSEPLQPPPTTLPGKEQNTEFDEDGDNDEGLINIGESPRMPQLLLAETSSSNVSASNNTETNGHNLQAIKPPTSTSLSFARVVKGDIPPAVGSGDAQHRSAAANSIMKNNASRRMVKSPGGTIRSNIVDEQV